MVVIAKETVTNQPTTGSTDTFQSILKAKVEDSLNVSVIIRNKHATAALTFRAMVSNDPEGSENSFHPLAISDTEGAETTISVEADTTEAIAFGGTFIWIDIQIESEDENSPQADAWMLAVA